MGLKKLKRPKNDLTQCELNEHFPDNGAPDDEEEDGPEYCQVAGPVHPLLLKSSQGVGSSLIFSL